MEPEETRGSRSRGARREEGGVRREGQERQEGLLLTREEEVGHEELGHVKQRLAKAGMRLFVDIAVITIEHAEA